MKWIRRHKVLSGLLGIVAIVIIAIVAASSGGKTPSTVSVTETTQAAPSAASAAGSAAASAVADSPTPTADPLQSLYTTVCTMLGDGASASDIAAVADQQLKKDGDTSVTGQQLVQNAEKQDCPQYLSEPTQTAPALTTAQQQAVDAAQNYLDLGTGFSKQGLLKQLTSSYGNGFSEKDAEFAVSYLKPDWNAQAVEAAKGYLKLGGFSRASLIQQLTSSYGSGFTEAQAEYAADKVGL